MSYLIEKMSKLRSFER